MYLPWWGGALALSAVTLTYWLLLKRPLGVSGSWACMLQIRELEAAAKAEREVAANPDAFEAALLAETMAAFGDASPDDTAASAAVSASEPAPLPWTAHLTFLVSLAMGGLVVTLARGAAVKPTLALGPAFERFFGAGALAFVVLLLGGVLVGFGTRLGGGCTSGHGLSGTSRFQPGSAAGTAGFFGAAVAVSLLLEAVVR